MVFSVNVPYFTAFHESHNPGSEDLSVIEHANLTTKNGIEKLRHAYDNLQVSAAAGKQRWAKMLNDEDELHDVCSQLKYKQKDLDALNTMCDNAQKHLTKSIALHAKVTGDGTKELSAGDSFQACATSEDPTKLKHCTTLKDTLMCKNFQKNIMPKLKIDEAFKPGGPCYVGKDAPYNASAMDNELMERETAKLLQDGMDDMFWFAIGAPRSPAKCDDKATRFL